MVTVLGRGREPLDRLYALRLTIRECRPAAAVLSIGRPAGYSTDGLRGIIPMSDPTDFGADERLEWYLMTPQQRWAETARLWDTYLAPGVPLTPNPIRKVLSSMRTSGVNCMVTCGPRFVSKCQIESHRPARLDRTRRHQPGVLAAAAPGLGAV